MTLAQRADGGRADFLLLLLKEWAMKVRDKPVVRYIGAACEYTYSGSHEVTFAKTTHGKIATCQLCKGEWEIRDGREAEIKKPIPCWPLDD